MDVQDRLEARLSCMTSQTVRCVGLIRGGEVAEGACLIRLHAVVIPCRVRGRLVERGVNHWQMDYNEYEEDDFWMHDKKRCQVDGLIVHSKNFALTCYL